MAWPLKHSSELPLPTHKRTTYGLQSSQNLTAENNHPVTPSPYFPSTMRAWNPLEGAMKNASTLERFKELVTLTTRGPLEYYYHNHKKWKAEIFHTKMRLRRSNIKEELHEVGLADTPMCACNADLEDAEHYFLQCKLHQHVRNSMIDTMYSQHKYFRPRGRPPVWPPRPKCRRLQATLRDSTVLHCPNGGDSCDKSR